MKHLYLFLPVFLAGTISAQYCTSGGPTSTVDSNVQLVRIVGQNDSIHHVGCPGVLGVQNLTAQSVTLNATTPYQLSVQFGTCNGNYLGSGEVWIDYDQSGSFDPMESFGTWTGTPPVPLSVFNVTLPSSARNGATRMRVMQREGNVAPPLDPCGTFQWGSVMDFTVNITGGVDCSAYPGDRITDAIPVTSLPYTHSWNSSYCYSNQNYAYPSPDVYYLVQPAANSNSIRISTCGSGFDTYVTVLDASGNAIGYNDDGTSCAPQSELNVSTIGLDTVYVVVEGWGSLSGAYTLNITQDFVGIGETDQIEFSMIPNPAQNEFRINGVSSATVEITDPAGKLVSIVQEYSGQNISTENWAAGIYFVRVTVNGISTTQKLAVKP